jgi:hypothetical protein
MPAAGPAHAVDGIDQAMTAMDVRAALAQLNPLHRQVNVSRIVAKLGGWSRTEIATEVSSPNTRPRAEVKRDGGPLVFRRWS